MTATFKSTMFAAMLSLAMAFGMTTGQAIFYPDTAQAGVIGKLKSAAKKVGGGVKKAAVTVGKAGKKVGVGVARNVQRGAVVVGTAGKRAGVGVARNVKRGAVAAGKLVAKTPPVKGVINAGRAIRRAF